MEKMDKEVKEAVKELLEKIPEDKLREAVGGFEPSVKNILICLGLVGFGALSGAGGFYSGKESSRKRRESNGENLGQVLKEELPKTLRQVREKTDELQKQVNEGLEGIQFFTEAMNQLNPLLENAKSIIE